MPVLHWAFRIGGKMQLQISYQTIHTIPVIEIVDQSLAKKPCPLAIFYHGWTSNKEESIIYGVEMAKRGLRAVLPDTIYHGARQPVNHSFENKQFVECLQQNLEEYPMIIDYYQERKLIKDDFIAVSGLSMGGITTCMLLTQESNIKAAGSIMGSPSLLKLSKHLIKEIVVTDEDFKTSDLEEDELLDMLRLYQQLFKTDLSMHPENIEGVPILFWHGEQDDFVRYDLTEEFVHDMQQTEMGENVYFLSDPDRGHDASYETTVYLASFFEAATQTHDTVNIWRRTKDNVEQLNYVTNQVVDHQLEDELMQMAQKDFNQMHGAK